MIQRVLSIRRAIVWAVMIGLTIPALLISGISWIRNYDSDIEQRAQRLLQKNADILSNGMQEPLRNLDQESAAGLLTAMMQDEDIVRIEVLDNGMNVFVSGVHPERRIGYVASTEKSMFYHGTRIGAIRLEIGSARLHKTMLDGLNRYLLALVAQIMLSVLLIMILLERRLVAPLRRLGAGAERLAQRQLDVPFTWKQLDEIGLFSQRLEATRVGLRNLFRELDQKNQELELDLDKRNQIEHELHEREERFRVLVEQSPIAIIEWDVGYHVIEWNSAAKKIFGYTRMQALGRHADFISTDIAGDSIVEIFRKLMNGGRELRNITQNRRADGKTIICQWNNTYITDKPGQAGRLISMAEDITEKRRAEEAHNLSQIKFTSAFHGSPDYITISRIDTGLLLDVNDAYIKFTGFSRAEAIGKTTHELGMWPYPQDRALLIEKLSKTGVARDVSINLRKKNGEIRACRVDANTFKIGSELHMMAVVRDVTDQRALEEQKAEADNALLRLAQGVHGMAGESFFELLVMDIASALRTERAFIGLRMADTPERIRTIAAYSHSRVSANFTYDIAASPCEHIMAHGIDVFAADVRSRFPDDAALARHGWESYAGAPIRDTAGVTIGVLAVMHTGPLNNADLVKSLLQVFSERASSELERKRAEEALRNSERQFAAMFHASPVSMSLSRFGGSYAIQDINPAFERLFVRPRDQVIGKDALELSMYCEASDRESVLQILKNNGRIDRFEAWMNLGDGDRALIQLSGTLFEVNGEKFIILTGENVTEKHLIETEILELNANLEIRVAERTDELQQANQELGTTLDTLNLAQEELVHSEKLAALGSLVAGIAHELNTPIGNSLMVASTLIDRTRAFNDSYAQGLKRSMLENYLADAGKAGDILVRNLHKAADLVTSFKQVAVDQTSSQRRSFTLSEVIAEIMLTLSPTVKKSGFYVKQSISGDIRMDSYPGPLGQVVSNLVNNALIHAFDNRAGGTVSIVAQAASEGWIELSVKDDGVGIAVHNIHRIFDPFFTTKLGAGGSGLGLNITHNIVTKVLGGRIRVQSEVGVGTVFLLMLPTVAPQMESDDDVLGSKVLFN